MKDEYVREVYHWVMNRSLFEMKPAFLRELRGQLLQKALLYYLRHGQNYYGKFLARAGISPQNARLDDLAKIAIPSDKLRWDGQKQALISDLPSKGRTYRSSGTTSDSAITVYRSPVDTLLMIEAINNNRDYVLGYEVRGGLVLLFSAPQMKKTISFAGVGVDSFEWRNVKTVYGMNVTKIADGRDMLTLKPRSIEEFYKSEIQPKYLLLTPAHLSQLVTKLKDSPALKLGKRGVIFMGGGTKGMDIPLEEVIRLAKKKIRATDETGNDVPAPLIDTFGMTESTTLFFTMPNSNIHIPHPLTEAFLVDPSTFRTVQGNGAEGLLGFWNPTCTSFLEAFYSGDILQETSQNNYYGKGFIYKRRLTLEEIAHIAAH